MDYPFNVSHKLLRLHFRKKIDGTENPEAHAPIHFIAPLVVLPETNSNRRENKIIRHQSALPGRVFVVGHIQPSVLRYFIGIPGAIFLKSTPDAISLAIPCRDRFIKNYPLDVN